MGRTVRGTGRTIEEGVCRQEIEYQPLPSQQRFHASKARFKGFSGPIGSGKSQALCHEAIKLSYVNAGRAGLIGAPTYPMLRDAVQTAFLEILETNRIPFDQNKAENYILMRDSRSKVLFRAVEEFERLRGTNLAWFGIDELTYAPEESWMRLEGRLRDPKATTLCGFATWTPKGYDWVYRRFLADPVSGYEAIIAKPFENRFLLEKVPDFYERLRNSYDENFYQQEVLGDYLNLNASRVYYAFDRQKHLKDAEPRHDLKLLWALDFNIDPMSSLVAQIDGEMVTVLDELVLKKATTEDACELFQSRFRRHAAGIVIHGDASGANLQTTGMSDYEIVRNFLQREGYTNVSFRVGKCNPPVRERVRLTNRKLHSAAGQCDIRIHPRCKELVRDFEEVSYKPESGEIDKDRDRSRTHLSDALGYLLWEEFGRGGSGERGRRLL